jgi:hypothetical protein
LIFRYFCSKKKLVRVCEKNVWRVWNQVFFLSSKLSVVEIVSQVLLAPLGVGSFKIDVNHWRNGAANNSTRSSSRPNKEKFLGLTNEEKNFQLVRITEYQMTALKMFSFFNWKVWKQMAKSEWPSAKCFREKEITKVTDDKTRENSVFNDPNPLV